MITLATAIWITVTFALVLTSLLVIRLYRIDRDEWCDECRDARKAYVELSEELTKAREKLELSTTGRSAEDHEHMHVVSDLHHQLRMARTLAPDTALYDKTLAAYKEALANLRDDDPLWVGLIAWVDRSTLTDLNRLLDPKFPVPRDQQIGRLEMLQELRNELLTLRTQGQKQAAAK